MSTRCCSTHDDMLTPLRRYGSLTCPQYCDRGMLGDAVDRGWLRTRRSQDAPPHLLAVLLTAQARGCGVRQGEASRCPKLAWPSNPWRQGALRAAVGAPLWMGRPPQLPALARLPAGDRVRPGVSSLAQHPARRPDARQRAAVHGAAAVAAPPARPPRLPGQGDMVGPWVGVTQAHTRAHAYSMHDCRLRGRLHRTKSPGPNPPIRRRQGLGRSPACTLRSAWHADLQRRARHASDHAAGCRLWPVASVAERRSYDVDVRRRCACPG